MMGDSGQKEKAKRGYTRSVVYTWIGSYLFLIVIAIVITLMAYISSKNAIEKEINTSNRLLLENIRNNTDMTLLEVSDLSIDIYSNSDIQAVTGLSEKSADLYYKLYKAASSLGRYKFYRNSIQGIYLKADQIERVIWPNFVSSGEDYYREHIQTEDFSYEQWEACLESVVFSDYIMMPYGSQEKNREKICAYVQNLAPFSRTNVTANLVFVLNLEHVLKDVAADRSVVILNDNNEIVASTKEDLVLDPAYLPQEHPGEAYFTLSDDRKQTISGIYSEVNDWKYITVTPDSVYWSRARSIQNLIWVELLLGVIGMTAISFYFVRRDYNIVKEITAFIRIRGKGNESVWNGDEFSFIRQVLTSSIDDKEKIESQLNRQTLAMRRNFMIGLLEGRNLEIPMNEQMSYCSVEFPYPRFGLAGILIKDLNSSIWDPEGDNEENAYRAARYAVTNVAEEILGKDRKVYSVVIHDLLIFLLNTGEEEEEFRKNVERDLVSIRDLNAQKLEIDLCLALSEPVDSVEEIQLAYQQVQDAISYVQVMGHGDIVSYHDIAVRGENSGYPYEEERKLINCIRAGESKAAEEIIHAIFSGSGKDTAVSDNSSALSCLLAAQMIRAFENESSDNNLARYYGSMRSLMKCTKRAEMEAVLLDLVRMLMEDVPSRSTIADMTISYEVQGIINSRYQDPSLCLASIAEELQRSPSYISRVFKAETGRSLVDYINEIRIAKAKELLREYPHEPQESIAEQVGISNIRTFQRLFKKIEGITPGRYRETYEPGMQETDKKTERE